jgi:hypothetical protein
MSSTIIPGVSEKLAFEYLSSYNDEEVKFMFTVCGTNNKKNKRFQTCREAECYVTDLSLNEEWINRDQIHIYLNQVNDKGWRLNENEILSLIIFESDDQLYPMFEMYAEKISRTGRVAARAAQEDEEDEYNPDDWDGDRQDETEEDVARWNELVTTRGLPDRHMKEFSAKEVDWVRWAQECEHLEKSSVEDELHAKLLDADQKIVQLEKQVEKTRRDLAMEWIMSMKPEEFEQRLLTNSGNYKLPDFPRAQPGDEDYPDLKKPQRQIAAPDYKYPLMPEEHERGKSNYACLHRKDLLYMSEEEFRACAYEEPTYDVYDGPWPSMPHTGVSDFDVYG